MSRIFDTPTKLLSLRTSTNTKIHTTTPNTTTIKIAKTNSFTMLLLLSIIVKKGTSSHTMITLNYYCYS